MPHETPIVTAEVSHDFSAPAEVVFDAWVNPQHIAQWFAQGLGKITHVAAEPVVGGNLTITQIREGEAVTHIGTYQQVIHPRRLIFNWTVEGDEGQDRIVVDIQPQPQGCKVTVHYEMDAQWAELVENAKTAWGMMLQSMARHLAAVQA